MWTKRWPTWEGILQKTDAQFCMDWNGIQSYLLSSVWNLLPKCNWCDYAQRKVAVFKVPCIQMMWLFPQLPAPLWNTGTNLVEKWVNPFCVPLSQPRWSQDSGVDTPPGYLDGLQSSSPYTTLQKALEGIIIRHFCRGEEAQERNINSSGIVCWWAEWTSIPLNSQLSLTCFLWPPSLS